MKLHTVGVALLRSLSPATGALLGGVGIAAAVLAGTIAEMLFGRPSSTAVIAFPFAFIFGIAGAAVGAFVGFIVRSLVRRTRWAGPTDRRVVGILLLLTIGVPSALSIRSVLGYETSNKPRVITTTGRVVRSDGGTQREPVSPATLLWASPPETVEQVKELRWNGSPVQIHFDDGQLIVRTEKVAPTAVDVTRLDYVREVHGVTATLGGGNSEWLALLVRLRATGRRELLVILDPQGTVAHEELLERRTPLTDDPVIWTAGPQSERQEVVVDVGSRTVYRGVS